MTNSLNWGIIGAGRIAKTFANGVAHSKTGTMLAVGSRSQEKAEAFGDELSVPRRYGTYEDLLADDDVQAVYVATPHPMHAEWAIAVAEAGKHVLCEKPIGLNHAEAMAIIEAAVRNDVFLMEAFMYRCSPQTAKIVELVRDGTIGEVRVIQASFSFQAGFDPDGRLFSQALGGGGILDVGGYPVSMTRLIAGVADEKPFLDPVEVTGCGHLGETGVDEWAAATLKFPNEIVAQVGTGVRLRQDNAARIFGSDGWIEVPWPWIPAREGGETTIHLHKGDDVQEIVVWTDEWLYGIEADTVARYLDDRQATSPAMSWDDTLGNMRTLDQWRESIGLVYDLERPEAQTRPAHGGPLEVRDGAKMTYGEIAGVERPVSRLIMGVDNQKQMPHAAVMFDDYIERGGNCFDTAYVYGGGQCERILGQWVTNRGVRSEIVILGKGAHTPHCNPEGLTRQFLESLERLQMDYVDIYMMHRDDIDVPVGEFIDVLNEHQAAGRMRAFGASNWKLERVREANAYAASKGVTGFAAVSNNFSLATMIEAPWNGCLSASDPAYRAWLAESQLPLMPWSSQARGFFVRGAPEFRDDPELVRCWYSDDNFQRLARAQELAEKRGVQPIQIALAYVLCQPFPTFPLIGPRLLSETRSSFASLNVELTPDEVKWLNLET